MRPDEIIGYFGIDEERDYRACHGIDQIDNPEGVAIRQAETVFDSHSSRAIAVNLAHHFFGARYAIRSGLGTLFNLLCGEWSAGHGEYKSAWTRTHGKGSALSRRSYHKHQSCEGD